MKIGFVFTNYNNASFTVAAVESLALFPHWNECEVVVVDNSSAPEDIELLRQLQRDYPALQVIFHPENVGYFPGLNLGIDYLRGLPAPIDLIVAGNNDLLFPPDFHDRVLASGNVTSRYAVVAPDLVTMDGVHQNPHVIRSINPVRELVWDVYYSNYHLARLISNVARATRKVSSRTDLNEHDKAQPIFQAYGACFLLTPVFFQHFDRLWAPTFLMGEEYFLSHQVEERGLEVYYEPRIAVVHHEHSSVSKLPGRQFWTIAKAAHAEYRKYVNPFRSRSRNPNIR
jgi:GT2 family glycosyltransferase